MSRAGGTALEIAAAVVDPEMPMLTLADLGVLRSVEEAGDGVVVVLTPTYSGCPALTAMRDDLVRVLTAAGYDSVEVRLDLSEAWSSDWITPAGRRALHDAGVSPPGAAPAAGAGPVALTLTPRPRDVRCPQCGGAARVLSEFGATACTALYRCGVCAEPFEHVKEI